MTNYAQDIEKHGVHPRDTICKENIAYLTARPLLVNVPDFYQHSVPNTEHSVGRVT